MAGHAQSLHHLSIQQNKAEFQEAIDGYKMPLDPPGLLEARLEAKLQEHNHVRAQAKRVLELHVMREEQKRIEEDMELERKRLFEEQQLRAQMEELNRMRSTHIEVPKLIPQQERAVTPPPPVPQPAPFQTSPAPQASPAPQPPTPQVAQQAPPPPKPASPIQTPAAPVENSAGPSPPSATSWPTPVPSSTFSPGVHFTPSEFDLEHEAAKYHQHPHALRYLQIHGSLKQMRTGVKIMCENNKQLKSFVGDMRRDLRKSVSQITGVRGANKIPRDRVMAALNRCLHEVPSDGVDPNFFLVKPRLSPVEGATNNGPTLPLLYLFFLNLFSKYILKQYVDQAGVNPEDADQIGNFCVSVFAAPANLWRGESMIDIMMAKFRVECPVLWGVRGSEGTVGGRKALGWRKHKDQGVVGDWMTAQDHSTRMTGLAAGYSSIALRDFSKASMKNPFPPPNWWYSMAAITGTEPDHVSNTQFIVLKYMIKGWEAKIFNYYGDKAKLALALAVITFPGKAKERTPAVRAVEIIADQLQKEVGMRFFQPPTPVVSQRDPWGPVWG